MPKPSDDASPPDSIIPGLAPPPPSNLTEASSDTMRDLANAVRDASAKAGEETTKEATEDEPAKEEPPEALASPVTPDLFTRPSRKKMRR